MPPFVVGIVPVIDITFAPDILILVEPVYVVSVSTAQIGCVPFDFKTYPFVPI